jgi:hypothetical protein
VRTFLRPTLLTLLCVPGLVAGPSATVEAAPRQATAAPNTSLERIRGALEAPPALRIKTDVPLQPAAPTFKSRVDQRVFVPTLEEVLRKEFDLTPMQRQSAEWASRCCGLNIGLLLSKLDEARTRREVRRIREQIAWELAELEAARKKNRVPDRN